MGPCRVYGTLPVVIGAAQRLTHTLQTSDFALGEQALSGEVAPLRPAYTTVDAGWGDEYSSLSSEGVGRYDTQRGGVVSYFAAGLGAESTADRAKHAQRAARAKSSQDLTGSVQRMLKDLSVSETVCVACWRVVVRQRSCRESLRLFPLDNLTSMCTNG